MNTRGWVGYYDVGMAIANVTPVVKFPIPDEWTDEQREAFLRSVEEYDAQREAAELAQNEVGREE